MNKMAVRTIGFLVIVITAAFEVVAQDVKQDTMSFSNLDRTRLSFFLDDMYFLAGVGMSGVHYSSHFRELNNRPVFVVGVGQYIPVSGKLLLGVGIQIADRNFSHFTPHGSVNFNNLYLDIPLTTSFELPIFRRLDFRVIFGANTGVRLDSRTDGIYHNENILEGIDEPPFRYQVGRFHSMDVGWIFGVSVEYRRFMLRAKSVSGFVSIDSREQGTLYALRLDLGYFLFRKK